MGRAGLAQGCQLGRDLVQSPSHAEVHRLRPRVIRCQESDESTGPPAQTLVPIISAWSHHEGKEVSTIARVSVALDGMANAGATRCEERVHITMTFIDVVSLVRAAKHAGRNELRTFQPSVQSVRVITQHGRLGTLAEKSDGVDHQEVALLEFAPTSTGPSHLHITAHFDQGFHAHATAEGRKGPVRQVTVAHEELHVMTLATPASRSCKVRMSHGGSYYKHYVEPPRNTTQDIEQNNFYAESRYDTFVLGRSGHDDDALMQRGTLWGACGWFLKAWEVPA